MAASATIASGTVSVVSAGETATNDTARARGRFDVAAGGSAISTTVLGDETVFGGGNDSGALILSDGAQIMHSGGATSGAVVSTGGVEIVSSGGVGANGGAVIAGGTSGNAIQTGIDDQVNGPQLRAIVSADGKRRSYIVRHWQGRLSLPVSYWINSFLGAIAIGVVFGGLGVLFKPTEGPATWAIAISAAWIFAGATTIWQLVGIWRSAGHHKSRGGSGTGFWAGAARFVVVLGAIGFAGTLSENAIPQLIGVWQIAAGDSDTGSHSLRILRGGTELEYSGSITFGATADVKKLLDADPAIRVLHLNSRGGRVAEARKLRDLIREHRLITYTSSFCASACTIAFLGGTQRYIAPDARLGFHRVSFPGLTAEELTIENDDERRWLIGNGVPAWFADRAYSTPSDSMWWPPIETLKQAGIVTAIARANDFALSGLPDPADQEKFEAGLLEVPTLAAIKRADPETYGKILIAMTDALKLGKSQAELAGVMAPFITNIAKKNIPIASDAAVSNMVQVVVAEIAAIGTKDADACYRFLYPDSGEGPIFIGDYISDELMQRDISATAAVIETGSSNPQRVPTEAEVSPSMKAVVASLARKYPPDDIAALADAIPTTVDRQKMCNIVGALYREVLMLPAPDRIDLLRYLFSQ